MSSLSLGLGTAALLLSLASFAGALGGGAYIQGGGQPGSGPYALVDDYAPANFFDKFSFYSAADPTKGFVQYVTRDYAQTNGLANTTTGRGTALMKAATTGYYPNGGLGRPSVRIESLNTYYHGLFILDATHMPSGCGTWPAYWLLGPTWPDTGEIDIIEGINTQENNTQALHTSPGCTVAGDDQTGILTGNNCDTTISGNSGCGVVFSGPIAPTNNYGAPFNAIGGGVYATEWTSGWIKTWFFPRSSIPSSITAGAPDTSQFGTPVVNQQGSCNIDSHFSNMSIIINIDLCGNYAGRQYQYYPECPATDSNSINSCNNYVGMNPSAMSEAYFEITRLQVYQLPASAVTTTAYSTSYSSVTTGLFSTNTVPQGMATSGLVTSSTRLSIASSSPAASTLIGGPYSSSAVAPSYQASASTATVRSSSSSAVVSVSYPAGASSSTLSSSNRPASTSTSLMNIGGTTALYTTSSADSTFVATSVAGGFTSTSIFVTIPSSNALDPAIPTSSSVMDDTTSTDVSGVPTTTGQSSWDIVGLPPYPATGSSDSSAYSASPTATFSSGAPCPTSSAGVCAGSSSTTCSTDQGTTYSVNCGVQYSGIVRRTVNGVTLTDCQAACDSDPECVGANYGGTTCETFSQIYSQSPNPGSVSVTRVPADEPACPGAYNTLYTDASGAEYLIDCSETYDGNDLGMGDGTYETSFTDCLALCDATTGCDGVEFDGSTNICYPKSAFGDAVYTGDNRIVGRKRLAAAAPFTSSSSSVGVAASYPAGSAPSAPATYPGGASSGNVPAGSTASLPASYPGGASSISSPTVTALSSPSFYPGDVSSVPVTLPGASVTTVPVSAPDSSQTVSSPGGRQSVSSPRDSQSGSAVTVTPVPVVTGPTTSGSTVYVPNPTCPIPSGTGTLTITPTITTCATQPVCSSTIPASSPDTQPPTTSANSDPSPPISGSSPNGVCGGSTGFNCYGAPSGSCCSQYGFCGAGDAYCGEGCQAAFGDCGQSAPVSSSSSSSSSSASAVAPSAASSRPSANVSPDGQCGGTNGFNCYGAPSGSCCSQFGFCGADAEHCGEGCQDGFGTCGSSQVIASSSSAPAAPVSYVAPGSSSSSAPPAPVTSAAASSTPVSNVAADGQCGGTTSFNCYGAPDGNCCSQYGYCGGDADHCSTGCQVGFGDCD